MLVFYLSLANPDQRMYILLIPTMIYTLFPNSLLGINRNINSYSLFNNLQIEI